GPDTVDRLQGRRERQGLPVVRATQAKGSCQLAFFPRRGPWTERRIGPRTGHPAKPAGWYQWACLSAGPCEEESFRPALEKVLLVHGLEPFSEPAKARRRARLPARCRISEASGGARGHSCFPGATRFWAVGPAGLDAVEGFPELVPDLEVPIAETV